MRTGTSTSRDQAQLGEFERVRRSPLPLAALAFLLALVPIEATVWRNRIWFADHASWMWETKARMVRDGVIEGDVGIIGTSVTLRGIDPTLARAASGGRFKPVNLAHVALGVQGYAQTWEEYLSRKPTTRLVFVELRELEVTRESWVHGPYFLHEARWSWFLESGVLYFEPSLLISFAAYRALPSLAYRDGLGNWISHSIEARALITETRDRNEADTAVMRERFGFSPLNLHPIPGRGGRLAGTPVPRPRPRPWRVTESGRFWLSRFLEINERNGVEVVLLDLPVPPYVDADRALSGYAAGRYAFIKSMRSEHPGLALEVWSPTGFTLNDFYDDLHFTSDGADKLSAQFSAWLQGWGGGAP